VKWSWMVVAIICGISKVSATPLPFEKTQRQAQLQKALSTLQKTPLTRVHSVRDLMKAAHRQQCRSLFDMQMLKCMLTQAKSICERDQFSGCEVLADLILVNLLNEERFISKEERFEISQENSDYPSAHERSLMKKYSVLATQLSLTSGKPCADSDNECLASETDRFCAAHAQEQHVPWQACSSGIIWFIRIK
jgi:hypothetical protein